METIYKLLTRLFALVVLMLAFSCGEECLRMDEIEATDALVQQWITDTGLTTKSVSSSMGINDVAELTQSIQEPSNAIEDDCDQVSQSYRYTVRYRFSNFPIRLETYIHRQGEEDGFEFGVEIDYTHNATYMFASGTSSSTNTVELITNVDINGEVYDELLKVTFNQTHSYYEVKELYYAKNVGVVCIKLNNNEVIYM